MTHRIITGCLLSLFATIATAAEPSLAWKVVPLAIDANEGIDIADFNGDGKLDVAAGRFWYQNPGFRLQQPASSWCIHFSALHPSYVYRVPAAQGGV